MEKFKASHVPVAAVATGFPSGQYSLTTRLEEIKYAINEGAKEIDIVINRTLALQVCIRVSLIAKNQIWVPLTLQQDPLGRGPLAH